MVADIKARLVLDTAGLQAVGGAVGAAPGAQAQTISKGFRDALQGFDLPILGDVLSGISIMILGIEAVGRIFKAGMDFLRRSSPRLATSIDLLGKSLGVLFRPIGDLLSLFLKPLAIAVLRFAVPIWKKWREFLESPQATAGLDLINTGIGNLVEGLTTLDFDLFKQGFIEVFEGAKMLASGFFGFAGENIEDFGTKFRAFISDAWEFFKEKFGGFTGFFGKIVLGAFNLITGNDFKSFEDAFGIAMGGIITSFVDNLGKVAWAGPMAPFFATMLTLWEELTPDLVDALVLALEEKLPGLTAVLQSIGQAIQIGDIENQAQNAIDTAERINEVLTQDDSERTGIAGIFGFISDKAKALAEFVRGETIPSFSDMLKTTDDKIGKDANDKGNTVIGAFNKTTNAMDASLTKTGALTSALNAIPTSITTVHTIITRRVEEEG